MKTVELPVPQIDTKSLTSANMKRGALERDCQTIIDEDVLITTGGEPVIAYLNLSGRVDTDALRWACQTAKYTTSKRTTGALSTSRVFGYMPRRTLLADYCHESDLKEIGAKQSAILKDFSKNLESFYGEFFPEVLARHYKTVEENILPEWRLAGSPFTSGIVNKNNPLKYHRDAGNFKGLFSNMVAFKKDVQGGRLCLPEFGIKFEIADNSLLIFDGQKYVHGVTPIIKKSECAYRYTVVWYSLEQMWNCLPLGEEVARIRVKKAEREQKRLTLKSV